MTNAMGPLPVRVVFVRGFPPSSDTVNRLDPWATCRMSPRFLKLVGNWFCVSPCSLAFVYSEYPSLTILVLLVVFRYAHYHGSDEPHDYSAMTAKITSFALLRPSAQDATFLAPPIMRRGKKVPKVQQFRNHNSQFVGHPTVFSSLAIHIPVHRVKASWGCTDSRHC